MKHYSPIGRRNRGRPLKRLLDTWDRNGSTSGLTPWETYDDDDDVQGSSPVVETSAGVPLMSMRPFAAAKWLAWLVSKESLRLSGSLPNYTKSATYFTAPLPSSPFRQHTKNNRVTKTLCYQYCTKTKQTRRNACTWSSGDATGGQWAATSPWILRVQSVGLLLFPPQEGPLWRGKREYTYHSRWHIKFNVADNDKL